MNHSATAAEMMNRNAGFIRQAGEWDWDESGVPVVGSGCAPSHVFSDVPFDGLAAGGVGWRLT